MRRYDSSATLIPIPAEFPAPMRLDLRIDVREKPDSRFEPFASVPIRFPLQTKLASAAPNQAPPPYPPRARDLGIQGTALMSFIIDTSGTVRPGSIRVVRTAVREFAEVAAERLRTMRFEPAQYRGCRVPSHERLPFEFSIGL